MATTKDKMERAKTLIQQKKYGEARRLLEGIDHPTAQKWRDKIDDILDDPFADTGKSSQQAPVQVIVNQRRSSCATIMLLLIGCAIVSVIILALGSNGGGGRLADAPAADAQPMEFTSAEYGLQAVIGPIDFPSGRWKATATTGGFIIAKVEATSGTCDDGFLGLFNLGLGQATDGAETTFTSRDCRGVITISNTQQEWTLRFDPIR